MINDPSVEEMHRYRKEHAARYGNDLNRIVEALRQAESKSQHIKLNPGPKLLSNSLTVSQLEAAES